MLEVNSTDTDCDDELSGIGQNIMFSDSSTIKEHYLTNLGLFYLKLQSKLLLLASTVNKINDEFQEVHNVGKFRYEIICHIDLSARWQHY